MNYTEFALRLVIALGAGFLIGFERSWHHKSAGLRTITLVTIGSALYVMLSIYITQTEGDVTRIIAQVVSGIGFLGAGIIFKEGVNVHGLTTAATVWCSSAIGCLAGAGYHIEAIVSTVLVLAINSVMLILDKHLASRGEGEKE
ncbi:MgtC/SapB family protein [Carboxylicivirga mesophila]|uniref:MgtC/SapB family protein n=1 Tax=Carboxylicivirga mesophila TaxID=1166478 RepID=A0ABS5KGT7_9BACT|nr:MgtC/SapB family protein [Carboxylicivirga mesophila]MBS2213706.1 MgtC/SapB family protein [Carboxylicivirga mesophila]